MPSWIHFVNLPLSGDAAVIIISELVAKAGEHNLALKGRKKTKRSPVFLSLVLFSLFEPNEDRKGCKDSSLFSLFLIFFCVSCVLCISEKQSVSSDSSMEITSGNYIPVQRLGPNVTSLLASCWSTTALVSRVILLFSASFPPA